MKKIYLLLALLIIFCVIILILLFVEIPSPSKLISEDYQLEIE